MTNEGDNSNLDLARIHADIENELARSTLRQPDPIVKNAIKMCVFHIILKAIALSKDPKADKKAILSLYQVAREIIINSTLDEDETTSNRLQDSINSMIDGDDISAQLRSYTATSRQWLDSKIMYLESKLTNIYDKNTAVEVILQEIDAKLNSVTLKKFPNSIILLGTGLAAILFTIVTSVAIISFLLTSAINNEGISMDQRQQMQQIQQMEKQRRKDYQNKDQQLELDDKK